MPLGDPTVFPHQFPHVFRHLVARDDFVPQSYDYHVPTVKPPTFYNAATHVPANHRSVLSFEEREGQPFHHVVYYWREMHSWWEIATDCDNHGQEVDVTRWCELPYPADAKSPPEFTVVELNQSAHSSQGASKQNVG